MNFNENGAVALEWYQKNYAPEYSIEELVDIAAKVDEGSDGLTALPCADNYPGLERFQNIAKQSPWTFCTGDPGVNGEPSCATFKRVANES